LTEQLFGQLLSGQGEHAVRIELHRVARPVGSRKTLIQWRSANA
jgi:hypothetical protein